MSLRIAVVGSGAIGSYYGAKLAYAGSDVHFLMRGDLSEVHHAGLYVRGKGENFRLAEVNCYNSTKEIGPCDLVLIAVKATSNTDLVDLVPPLKSSATIMATSRLANMDARRNCGHKRWPGNSRVVVSNAAWLKISRWSDGGN